jgi:methenyltetrahydromethanopterin cyclohydrolase
MNYFNEKAWGGFIEFSSIAERLACEYIERQCGVKLIDAGVNVRGGFSAGLRMIELSTANLSTASLVMAELDGELWPHVEIRSDQPYWGCFISQSGNRAISVDETKTIYSGPACLLADREGFKETHDASDDSDCAVLIMEGDVLPDNTVCEALADRCRVIPSHLGIVVAPTASLAGVVQIAGRSVEATLQKLDILGIDPTMIRSAVGRCPAASPGGDALQALGRVNDVLVRGSQVWLAADGPGSIELLSMLPEIIASTSRDYDRPFLEILAEAGQFFQIDKSYFGPAEISIVNLENGSSAHIGKRDESRLATLVKL